MASIKCTDDLYKKYLKETLYVRKQYIKSKEDFCRIVETKPPIPITAIHPRSKLGITMKEEECNSFIPIEAHRMFTTSKYSMSNYLGLCVDPKTKFLYFEKWGMIDPFFR